MKASTSRCVSLLAILLSCSAGPAGAATIYVAAGSNLQQALNAAQPGDTILLQEGAEFAGNFVLPVKSGDGWITLRSSAPDSVLPPAGVRIRPADAPLLARLRSPTIGMPALRTAAGAHHWQIRYLEFAANPWGQGDIIQLGDGSTAQNSLALVPHDIVLSHVYVHGDPAVGQKRGIALNASFVSIVDSHISDCKGVGQDTQAIAGWNGPGPFTIENNYLEGAGENVMFGGADPAIPNLVPDGITFRRNYVSRPMSWRSPIIPTPQGLTGAAEGGGSLAAGAYAYRVIARRLVNQSTMGRSTASQELVVNASAGGSAIRLTWAGVPGATEYRVYGRTSAAQSMYWQVQTTEFVDTGAAGTSEAVPTSAGTVWTVKNLFELKNARNVVVEDNVFENHWKEAQPGWSIVLTPRNSGGGCSWCVIENLRFEWNLVRNVSGGVNILGYDSGNPSRQAANLVFRHNLFRAVTTTLGGSAWFMQLGDEPRDIIIEHNTIDANGSAVTYVYGGSSTDPREVEGFQMTANAARHNSYGINGAYFSYGNGILTNFFPGAVFLSNYLAGGSASRYPAGTLVSGLFTDQFVAAATGDFTLRSDSILKGSAPDGSDIGVDYATLVERLDGVESGVSGVPPPPPPPPSPPPPAPPTAALTVNCSYLDCAFSDTSTAGSAAISGRSWTFGDGGTSTAASGTHTYSAAGTYTVTLTVVDGNGLSDSESSSVTVTAPPPINAPPVAAFDYACVDLTCTFTDRSTDSDGALTAWSWAFGTAGTASTASPTFTFPAAGTYQVSLTVDDDDGARSTTTKTVDVRRPIHLVFVAVSTNVVGNGTWKAAVTIAVHTANEQPLPGATVIVSWSGAWNKTTSCTTNSTGQCTFKTGSLSPQQTSVTLTVTNVTSSAGAYDPTANHSLVAGGTGTAITITKP
jgi:PKD repeat protein